MSQSTQEQGQQGPDLNAQGNTATSGAGTGQAGAVQGSAGDAGQGQGTGSEQDSQGKGSKREVLADLAQERQQRHQLEQQVAQQGQQLKDFLDGIGKALGIKTDEQTPEQLQAALVASQQETNDSKVLLGVYAAAHQLQADPTKIMDSVRVRDQLKNVDPSDTAKITEVITKAVADNPQFKITPTGAGSGDAGAGGGGERTAAQSMNDWIRQAARSR